MPPENVDAMAEVRRRTTGADRDRRAAASRATSSGELFEKQACHVIQPDLCHCGGLWEAQQDRRHGGDVTTLASRPHNPLGPVANAAALHFALSTPNFLIQEDMLSDVPWRWEVVEHSLTTKDGYWLPADAPGLGIEVNEDAARRHPFQQEMIQGATTFAPDGAVLDW